MNTTRSMLILTLALTACGTGNVTTADETGTNGNDAAITTVARPSMKTVSITSASALPTTAGHGVLAPEGTRFVAIRLSLAGTAGACRGDISFVDSLGRAHEAVTVQSATYTPLAKCIPAGQELTYGWVFFAVPSSGGIDVDAMTGRLYQDGGDDVAAKVNLDQCSPLELVSDGGAQLGTTFTCKAS